MKLQILTLGLLLGACQAPDASVQKSVLPVDPAPKAQAEEAPTLPRWTHSDRAQYAVRAWVRDLR